MPTPLADIAYFYHQRSESKAVFAQLTYNVTDQLKVAAGGRYTWETAGLDQITGSLFNLTGSTPLKQKAKLHDPSWTFNIQYQIDPQNMVYFAQRGSFRAGGFNGAVVPFEPIKIAVAMMKAFLAVHGTQGAASASVRETVDGLTQAVMRALMRSRPGGGTFHIEDVQDQVELGLMRGGHHEIARAYVLYREKRTQERARQPQTPATQAPQLHVLDGGKKVTLDIGKLQALIEASCAGLGAEIKPDPIVQETMRNLYDGVPIDEVYKASILAARTLIEKDPDYTYATARLLLHTIRREVLGEEVTQEDMGTRYAEYFPQFIAKGVQNELLDERLQQFDLERLGAALKPERDLKFDYLGLQTLFDRYFLHVRKQRIELPQAFFMRVAMGLSLAVVGASGAMAQSAAAKTAVDAAKAAGTVGEQADGFLGIVAGGDAALRASVAEINTGRAAAYKDIAAKIKTLQAAAEGAVFGGAQAVALASGGRWLVAPSLEAWGRVSR